MFHHITQDERTALSALLRAGFNQSKVAKQLGINRSSICRELSRNKSVSGIYHAKTADNLAKQRRRRSKVGYRKIESNPILAKQIEDLLDPLYSPETAAHALSIAHETIYAWIYRSRPDLINKLPYRGKKRRIYGTKRNKKQGWTKNVRPIEERPIEADDRTQTGHFEGDTIRGENGSLLTHTDRKSRFEIAHLIKHEYSDIVYEIVSHDKYLSSSNSITYDRGSCFSLWQMIEKKTRTTIYFANAHRAWERGTNENTNGRLRRVFPKGFDFATITQKDVDKVVWKMNHTPRKCLNWRTPCEVYGKCCVSS